MLSNEQIILGIASDLLEAIELEAIEDSEG